MKCNYCKGSGRSLGVGTFCNVIISSEGPCLNCRGTGQVKMKIGFKVQIVWFPSLWLEEDEDMNTGEAALKVADLLSISGEVYKFQLGENILDNSKSLKDNGIMANSYVDFVIIGTAV